jgi:zinc protease
VEEATLAQLDAVRRHGITEHELRKAKNQLRARLVFEGDSISNIAHQLGYFETIASWRLVPQLRERIDSVMLQQVNEAAANYFKTTNRTVGWFDPHPSRDEGAAPEAEGAGGGPISSRKR